MAPGDRPATHEDGANARRARRSTRSFARLAAAAFFLVAAYTVIAKVATGEIADDWMHSVLHVASGSLAVYAGWLARGSTPATVFAASVAVVYGVLGVTGWFVDGLFLTRPVRIPLGAADNVFHLVLAVLALAALVAVSMRPGRPRHAEAAPPAGKSQSGTS